MPMQHPAYLSAARQARLCALACPELADTFKARAAYWLTMAGAARRSALRNGWRLP
jgi:hypothetical protein